MWYIVDTKHNQMIDVFSTREEAQQELDWSLLEGRSVEEGGVDYSVVDWIVESEDEYLDRVVSIFF